MPTTDEFQALSGVTTSAWTADYEGSGVAGLVLTSNADSSKKLFFPTAGFCKDGSVNYVSTDGKYWSSSRATTDIGYAYILGFSQWGTSWKNGIERKNGHPVRGVVD